ncbi:MAG: hypothetical protein ACREQF_11355 [Candidatus Binataceae bacterium]
MPLAMFLFMVFAAVPGIVECSDAFDYEPLKFEILDSETREIVGYGGYQFERAGDQIVLKGQNRYLSGEYDSETTRMKIVGEQPLPVLVDFEHSFYNADGSIFAAARADFSTGAASCKSHKGAEERNREENLELPPATYAGATILIAIQRHVESGERGPFNLYAFNCAPGPRVLPLEVTVDAPDRWPYGGGQMARVEVVPRFGWWDIVIKPFLPRLNAWFDPRRDWSFAGATLARYYRGPEIVMVAVAPNRGGARTYK